jgi:hypothetical protein
MQRVIYRVENTAGYGIYSQTAQFDCEEYRLSGQWGNMRHPLPNEDHALKDTWASLEDSHEYLFGFSSLEQFRSWISTTAWRSELHKNDYRINLYLCNDSYVGDTQAIFRLSAAECIGTIALDTLE